jgi:iron complex outermembrane receptor protein
MAARLAYSKRKSDGFIKNVTQNRDVWDDDQDTVVGKLLWRPTDTFELVLKGDYYKKDAANYGGVLGYVAPGSSAAGYIQFITGGTDSMSNYITDDYYTSYDDSALYAEVKETGAAAIATWDLDPLTVKFIYGYRELDYATNMDLDGTPYFVMDSTTALEGHRSQSAELQFLGSAMEDRLDWIVGLFYFVENGRDGSVSVAMPLLNPGSPTISDGEVENRSNAIFAQGTYQLTDAVSLTLGLRYSDESRELVSFNRNGAGCTIAPSLRDAPGLCQSSQTFDDSSTDYLFTINYQPVDFISTYFKVATGFRSGGLNLRGTNEATFQPFKSESVTDYEIGMKADWLDRRLRTNIAFFYSDYQDIQRNVITASFNPDGSVAGSNTVFSNAAAGTVKGAELEISALPFDNLELSASFGYTDASYDKYPDTFTSSVGGVVVVQPFDRSNEPYVSVPEYTWSLAATHRYDTPIGELTTRVDYMWKDEVMTQAPTRPDETPDSLMAKELGLLNARIGLTVGDTGLNVGIWGRNLTDEDSNVYNLSMLNSLGHVLRLGNQPRTYGVEVNYTF